MIFNDSRAPNAGFVGMITTTKRSTNEYRQQRLSQTPR